MNKEKTKKTDEKTEIVKTEVSLLEQEVGKHGIEDLKQMIDDAEKQVEFIKKIKELSLKLTNEDDWVDEGGEPYLEISGTTKIRTLFGVSIKGLEKEIINMKDENGEYIIITVKGTAVWRGNEISEIGTSTTRDDFFGKVKGKMKKLEEIDLTDLIKKANTNFQNRVIKKILGLYFTWDDLKTAGLNIDKIKKIKYNTKVEELSEEDVMKQQKIILMLNELYGERQGEMLKKLTAFISKDGKEIPGVENVKELTGKRLEYSYNKIVKHYEEEIKKKGVKKDEQHK